MKRILFLILALFPTINCYSQTISDLTSNAKEAKEELYFIYDLNVFEYFDYDTELKKEMFMKTDEYQNYLTQLKGFKAEMLKTTYFYSLFSKSEGEEQFSDYNVKRKGFVIGIGSNCAFAPISAVPPKCISINLGDFILLKALPIKQVTDNLVGEGVYNEELFIPMSESDGLEIENDRSNIDLYFFFTPSGKETVKYQFLNMGDNSWYNRTDKVLKSNKLRVIVANKSSGKIYYDKTYTYQPPAPKK